MWRSVFIALGVMAIVIGAECLVIDSANVYAAGGTKASTFVNPADAPSANMRVWKPKEWVPWALLSCGAITVVYAFTLPKRWHRPA